LLGLVASIGLVTGAATASAKDDVVNPYSTRHGHPYRHGAVPTREAHAGVGGRELTGASIDRRGQGVGPRCCDHRRHGTSDAAATAETSVHVALGNQVNGPGYR
jgi:hypothetical protein